MYQITRELISAWFHTVFESVNYLSTERYKLICTTMYQTRKIFVGQVHYGHLLVPGQVENFTISTPLYGLAHKDLVLNAYVQKPPLDANADASSKNKGLTFGLILHLNPYLCVCKQHRLWPDCAFMQACLSLHCSTV